MQIDVNGKTLEVTATTLEALLRELAFPEASVATAVNQDFVRKTERRQTELKDGDTVEILTPRQGG
jgi:sulfur carrier protein